MKFKRNVLFNCQDLVFFFVWFLGKGFAFADTPTVLSYISSGYVYKEAVSPNTMQLTYTDYFARYSSMNSEELKLVDASLTDYSSINYSLADSTLTDDYQKIMTVFYNNQASILQSYYEYDKISNSYQKVELLIDPCRNKSSSECVESKDPTNYTDNREIKAVNDLQIAFYTNTTILNCSDDWKTLINCGSFIEIHRPFDPQIILQRRITLFLTINYTFFYFNTEPLCAGKYELWYVVRTRVGVVLQYTKPLFVTYPSCDCSDSYNGVWTPKNYPFFSSPPPCSHCERDGCIRGDIQGSYYFPPIYFNQAIGKVKLYWEDGSKYEGDVVNSKMEGKGKFFKGDGSIYEGDFKDNSFHGQGSYNIAQNNYWSLKYEGEFYQGTMHGKGKAFLSNGDMQIGEFFLSNFEKGEYIFFDGQRRQGEFKHYRQYGEGKLFYPDGRIFVGNFAGDDLHGQGTLFSKEGQVLQKGYWRFNTYYPYQV